MSIIKMSGHHKPVTSELSEYWVIRMKHVWGNAWVCAFGKKSVFKSPSHLINSAYCNTRFLNYEFESCLNPKTDQDDARDNG